MKKKEQYITETIWPAKPKTFSDSILMTSDLHVLDPTTFQGQLLSEMSSRPVAQTH